MSNSNRTPEEQALMTKAAAVLPGGSLGNLRLDEEHAFVVREGRGSRNAGRAQPERSRGRYRHGQPRRPRPG